MTVRMSTVDLTGMLDTFVSQCRNAAPGSEVKVVREVAPDCMTRAGLIVVEAEWHGIGTRVALVPGPNVKTGKGLWWFDEPWTLGDYDGVAVYLGFSQEQGAMAACSGNIYKDDYRRLSYAEDLVQNGNDPHVFRELPYRMTEANLRALFTRGRMI